MNPLPRHSRCMILALVLCSSWPLRAAEAPEPGVLEQIESTVAKLKDVTNRATGLRLVRELEAAVTNEAVLIQQLVMYRRFKVDSEWRGYGAWGITANLAAPKPNQIRALLPLLADRDTEIQKLTADTLKNLDKSKGNAQAVDFSQYESILREDYTNPPLALVRYLYERKPEAAVLTLARVYSDSVPTAEIALKSQARSTNSVKHFVDRPEWWAHLFAIAVLKETPALRTDEFLTQLARDSFPLVQEGLAELRRKP